MLLVREALAQGRLEQGVHRRQGDVRISGDSVSTGADGEVVFVVGKDAMLVRRNSELSILKTGLRIVTGAVLSVFGGGRRQLRTTCYGEAVLEPRADPKARETVRTLHHEQPRYILAKGAPQMILRAPVVNHTDAELVFLESLVGREPPFVGKGFQPY